MIASRFFSCLAAIAEPGQRDGWFTAPRIILLVFGATVLLVAVRRLRAYRLKERYTIMFLFAGMPFLVLAIWPGGVGWIATRLQIEYRTVSVLCLAAFFILMVFELLTIVSLQDRRIATLAQIVGILMEKHGMSDRQPGPPPEAAPDETKG